MGGYLLIVLPSGVIEHRIATQMRLRTPAGRFRIAYSLTRYPLCHRCQRHREQRHNLLREPRRRGFL